MSYLVIVGLLWAAGCLWCSPIDSLRCRQSLLGSRLKFSHTKVFLVCSTILIVSECSVKLYFMVYIKLHILNLFPGMNKIN